MRNQRGFSLIEFLIVVAILGIIAAIAIPSLRRAEQNSGCIRIFGFTCETMRDGNARPVVNGAVARTLERMDKDIADASVKEGELRKTPILLEHAARSLSEANALAEQQRLLDARRESAKQLLRDLGLAAPGPQ